MKRFLHGCLGLVVLLAACGGGGGKEAGTEGGPCYGNGTCNDGLDCVANVCMNPSNPLDADDGTDLPDNGLHRDQDRDQVRQAGTNALSADRVTWDGTHGRPSRVLSTGARCPEHPHPRAFGRLVQSVQDSIRSRSFRASPLCSRNQLIHNEYPLRLTSPAICLSIRHANCSPTPPCQARPASLQGIYTPTCPRSRSRGFQGRRPNRCLVPTAAASLRILPCTKRSRSISTPSWKTLLRATNPARAIPGSSSGSFAGISTAACSPTGSRG